MRQKGLFLLFVYIISIIGLNIFELSDQVSASRCCYQCFEESSSQCDAATLDSASSADSAKLRVK